MKSRDLAVCAAVCAYFLAPAAWGHSHDAMSSTEASGPVSDVVTATDCWIRQLPAPAPSGAFVHIHNQGDQPAVLVGASSSRYDKVMMHQTTESDGMSKMAMVSEVSVPAHGELAFKPGGYHLMLEQAQGDIAVGDTVKVDFSLKDGGRVAADCEVKPATAMSDHAKSGHSDHMHMNH